MIRTLFVYAAIAAGFGGALTAQTKPVFRENFASGKLDPAVWDVRTMGAATIAVEPVEGAHGKYALHTHYPEGARGSYAMAIANHVPDSVSKHVFGRAWMKITGTVPPTHNPLMITGEPGWQISKFYEIGLSRTHWMLSYQENKSKQGEGRGEVIYRADVSPPFDKWFLLEWEINDDPGGITIWVDGQQIQSATGNDPKVDSATFKWKEATSNLVGGFREFGFGARCWGNPATGFDVYYSDIALGTSRIGK